MEKYMYHGFSDGGDYLYQKQISYFTDIKWLCVQLCVVNAQLEDVTVTTSGKFHPPHRPAQK
jgi:hypothetical protein